MARSRTISSRRPPKSWFALLAVIALALLSRFWTEPDAPVVPPAAPADAPVGEEVLPPPWAGAAPSAYRMAFVERVVDGDTLLLAGGERVRLLGVDTPETKKPNSPVEPFGPEASAFTAQQVERKMVRLDFDRERVDQYGRTLAYVSIDGLMLNEELIRQGLSAAHTQYPYRDDMKKRFLRAEEEAREQNRGLWTLPEFRASRSPVRRPPSAPTPQAR